MFREINTEDAPEVAEICKAALGYDVDVESVKRQIEKRIEKLIDKEYEEQGYIRIEI